MSKAKLKKALNAMDKQEIISMVEELYDARKEAKEYLEYWINPDPQKELERVEKLIERQFVTPQGVNRRSPSLPAIAKIIKDFMTICFDPEKVAELLLFLVEKECEWLEVRYRRVSYRTNLQKNLREAELYIETNALESLYAIRLERLKERVEALDAYQTEHTPRRRWFRFR